jgi:HlyD family secretion protein
MTRRLLVVSLSIAAIVCVVAYLPARRSDAIDDREWPTLRASADTLENSVVAVGTVTPDVGAQVKVGSQLSGIVEKLKVNAGDVVKKGDVLAILNTIELRARIDEFEAQAAAARAELIYAEKQVTRFGNLDDFSQNQRDAISRDLDLKRSDAQRIDAQLRQARIQLGYATIKAPLSGTVESVSTYEGETVAASFAAPTFVTIVDLNRLEIDCFVDEGDVGKVRVGQQVTFNVDAYPAELQRGVVRTILPKAQLINSVVNYIVIVDILDREKVPLRPQMTARVNFVLERKEGVISIPRSALITEGGVHYLVVRAPDGWVKREVRIGMNTSQRMEVNSGLKLGDVVLADGQRWSSGHGGG